MATRRAVRAARKVEEPGRKVTVRAAAAPPRQTQVVDLIREFVSRQELKVGERLPGERELAAELGVSRGEVRKGLGYLAALGVVEVRHGAGAFLADAKAAFGSAPLELLKQVGGFDRAQMFEARRALECELIALAAERATGEHFAAMAEELAEMFATVEDAAEFLVHDVRFHRSVAKASGNPILAALMDAIVGALYEERQRDAGTKANRIAALEAHREMYHAMKARSVKGARTAMERHLRAAEG